MATFRLLQPPRGWDFRLLGVTTLTLLLAALTVGAARASEFVFEGGTEILPSYGAHYPPGCYCVFGGVPNGYADNSTGSFTDPTAWDNLGAAYYPQGGLFSPNAPQAGDYVLIGGAPNGEFAPTQGLATSVSTGNPPISIPVYGYYGTVGGYLGYFGTNNGFLVGGATGTIGALQVEGPGKLSLGSLTVTGIVSIDPVSTQIVPVATSIASFGGIPLFSYVAGYPTSSGPLVVTGYAPSVLTIAGGTLTTPSLTLAAGTSLSPVIGYDSNAPDPVADAGSLTIDGAKLSGDITRIYGVPPGTPSTEPYNAQPVTLTNATLNAKTELDIVGIDKTLYPNATGTTTLAASGSTINAGNVVIATGATGYGSGSPGTSAALTLSNGSTLTATSSVFVGDTGDGVLTASGKSTINDQQAVLGNATGSTGTATIDGSTWNNAGYLSVGNSGVGTLTVQNGGQIMNTGPNGNAFISGLTGSSGSQATVTGQGSLWQTSGYFEVAASGTGTLTVADNARVVTGNLMFLGEAAGATGTLAISGAATVTNNTTGGPGTSSTVLGFVADSTGILTVDGAGSQLESKGAMSVGYGGTGVATITGGGALIVDSDILRVGRNLGSTGTLTVTGGQSSVTANNATIYVGYGGTGTVNVENGATMTVQATSIGGLAGGVGTITVDGKGTHADLGDTTVGDAGNGTLNVTGGATVGAGDIVVGAQAGDPGTITVSGANSGVVANGDLTVGGGGTGTVLANTGSNLTVQGSDLTIGNETTGNGLVTLNGATLSFGGNLVVGAAGTGELLMQEGAKNALGGTSFATPSVKLGDQTGSQGMLALDGKSTSLQVSGLTVGELGQGTLTLSNNAVLTSNGDVTVADQISGAVSRVTVDTSAMLAINGNLTVGSGGIATMVVTNGGKATAIGDVAIGDNPNGNGTVTVDGAQPTAGSKIGSHSSLGYGQTLTVGNYGTGTLNVTGGALVAPTPKGLGEVDVAAQSGSKGTVTVSGSDPKSHTASQLAANDLAVGGTMKAAGGTGNLTVSDGGAVLLKTALQLWNNGTVDVSGGGGVTVGSGASAKDGTVQVDAGGTLGGGGTINGDLVDAGGTVSPGDPMTLNVNGNYVQNGGILDIQIAGTGPGEFDKIDASGSITITSGTINFDFIDGFAPQQGNTFDFLSAFGSINLSLSTFDVVGLAPGFDYKTMIDHTTGNFELAATNNGVPAAVPEPSSAALLGSGLGFLGLLVLKRRRALHSRVAAG